MTSIDTPAAEARDALDLDAIQARVDAATPGPWVRVENIHCESWVAVEGREETRPITLDKQKDGWQPHFCTGPADYGRGNAEFVAHARADVPALVARIRELEAALVIPADTRPYETQTQALDALPVHTLVSYRDHDGELHTLERVDLWGGSIAWWCETTTRSAVATYSLVRNEVDYTIVRMGDGS